MLRVVRVAKGADQFSDTVVAARTSFDLRAGRTSFDLLAAWSSFDLLENSGQARRLIVRQPCRV
jgi:hypothetical protein